MGQSNVDVGVFQETNITYGIYTRGSAGYKVVATLAPSWRRGNVALFYWDPPDFAVEVIRQFDATVIACQLETGNRRWYIIGCYLAPGDDTTILDVEAAMAERLMGKELIFAGKFNVDLEKTGGWGRDKEIAAAVVMAGLEDLAGHFLLRRRACFKDRRMWEVVSQGKVVRYQTEYILGSERRIFQNMAVRDLRQKSDHIMVLGCLRGASPI